jgi:hypothetical protein
VLDELEKRLQEARTGGPPLGLEELEALYTNGCAAVLELEAENLRTQRRLSELRDRLRHIRTAIEFLQDEQAARDPRTDAG